MDERDALVDMDLSAIEGMLLGGKGFIRPILMEDLARQCIDLCTPLRSNMKDSCPRGFMRRATRARRLVETVIGQLYERFEIVDAQPSSHLPSTVPRTLNFCRIGSCEGLSGCNHFRPSSFL